MTNPQLSEYRRSQVMGMSQIDLVIMLYQGAIRFLNEAIQMLEAERYDQSWQKFDRARKIVVHMLGTLNFDAGELAQKFASLYAYLIEQITVANARRDADVARQCIDVLNTLKEGWDGVAAQALPDTLSIPESAATAASDTDRAAICVEA
ncbi:MAG: flagellar export chaperone FliS [Candidatus Zixiibacteriota bacterium]